MARYELYHGNCLDILPTGDAGSVDLTVTSPPYDNLRDYGESFNADSFDWHGIIKELYRVTAIGGVVVWVVADQTINGSETGTSFRQALWAMDCGFSCETMIWDKMGFAQVGNINARYPDGFEYMFIWSKGYPKIVNLIKDRISKHAGTKIHNTTRYPSGETKPSHSRKKGKRVNKFGVRHNVWAMAGEQSNTKRCHPAQMSEQLARDHIISWSNPGDTVLDPFLGSGTTGVACGKLKRNFIGIELEREYYDIAETRIKNAYGEFEMLPAERATGQLPLF